MNTQELYIGLRVYKGYITVFNTIKIYEFEVEGIRKEKDCFQLQIIDINEAANKQIVSYYPKPNILSDGYLFSVDQVKQNLKEELVKKLFSLEREIKQIRINNWELLNDN